MMHTGRVAVITGGGTGIGAAAARAFAAKGVAVAIVGRRPEPLNEVAADIGRSGGQCLPIKADMGEASAPGDIIEKVVEKWGRVDVIVNNAAVIQHKPVEQASAELFDAHMAVNVRGPYLLVQRALPYLRKSGCASVVNISSASAWLAIPGQSMYGTSKAALQYLTKSLAAELAPDVRVNCIAPGPVDTPIHLSWAGGDVKGAYERMQKEVPLKRMGTADEIAAWIIWLSGPEAAFVTGAVIPVDGGQTLPGALSKITM